MLDKNQDPNLVAAMAEIRAICQKHKIGAVVALASQTHGEFGLEVPEWSCLQYNKETGEMRLRAKSGETREGALDETLHFLLSTRDACAYYSRKIGYLEGCVREQVDIVHKNGIKELEKRDGRS